MTNERVDQPRQQQESILTEPRRARPDDSGELARLRLVMLHAEHPIEDSSWTAEAARWFRDQLDANPSFAAYVIADSSGLVCCAAGLVNHHPPRPGTSPYRGHIFSVATDPEHRRRGYARACVSALREWLVERGAASVTLTSSPDGHELYRSLGFVRDPDDYMVWRQSRSPES